MIDDQFTQLTDWLRDYKLALAISDTLRDSVLWTYLELAREAIWTQYYGFELPVDEFHDWARDSKTKMATIHLAVTYFSNPDINLEARDVKDSRMIFRILGSRTNYKG